MSERVSESRDSLRLYLLTALLSALTGIVLFFPDWAVPTSLPPQYWNGLVAFSVLAVICDSSFLPISRITSANVRSSVAFIPLLASVVLFEHPWPMLMSGRSEEHTSELQSHSDLVCRLLLEKKNK